MKHNLQISYSITSYHQLNNGICDIFVITFEIYVQFVTLLLKCQICDNTCIDNL